MMGMLPKFLQRGADSQNSSVRSGCIPIADAPIGRIVRIGGDITSVVLRPVTTTSALEAEIDDGTGRLVIVWLGRSAIRGVEPGRGIVIEGRVVRMEHKLMMHNPKYELAPRGPAE
jgi:RecG-like helicase